MIHFKKLIICSVAIAGLLSGCSERTASTERDVLAEVGDEIITVEEFRLSYEFGHAHLRRGEDAKRTYLNYMIYEALMAQEAERLDLDTLMTIRSAQHTLREELLIERVFDAKVLSQIEVTEEEIQAEINKTAVSFQFRFMPAASRQDAEQLHVQLAEKGFEIVLEERKAEIPELSLIESQLTSPYLKADEIDPELLVIIQNLELNAPSQPVQYQGEWYIFEVTDIRRIRLAPDDYTLRAPSVHKVIYNRKAMEMGGAFVQQTMEPLGVRTKREGFEVLNEALFAWYSQRIPERNLLYYIEKESIDAPYVKQLVEHYETPLVEFGSTAWGLEDFLENFTPGRYILRPDSPEAFKARLADVIALVVRDHVFLNMADTERLDENPSDRRNMEIWTSKWLTQEYKRLLREDTTRSWNTDAYEDHAKKLKDAYPVKVRWEVLDTLQVTERGGTPGAAVYLLKSNSNKQPFPIVDPDWGSVQ